MRRTAGVALAAMALVAGCGGDSGEGESQTRAAPYLESAGALGAPVLGRLVDGAAEPTPAFATSETEAVAFVSVRSDQPAGKTLVVEWYRLRGEARERLFSHEIAVTGRGRARSHAVARGGLPPGLYETVATLGNLRTRTPWIVSKSARPTRALSGATGSALEAGEFDWERTYYEEPREPEPEPAAPTVCEPSAGIRAFVELSIRADWNEPCERLTIAASVTGPPETLWTIVTAEQMNDIGRLQYRTALSTDFCAIPGGSDLPGTVVKAVVTDSGGASATAEEPLPDAGAALQAGLDPTPAAGSRVSPGDRIKLHALALLMNPALGVKTLYVNVGDELLESTGNLSGSSEPVACDFGRLLAQLRTEYRVPANPPPVIEVCANATGFDGTEAEPDCAQFYTGEVWEGTIEHVVTAVPASGGGPCGSRVRLEGTVRIVVDSEGRARGTYDVSGCGVTESHGEFTGTADAGEFRFPELVVQTNGEPIPKVSPTEARATLTNFQGQPGVAGAEWVTTWSLDCKTC